MPRISDEELAVEITHVERWQSDSDLHEAYLDLRDARAEAAHLREKLQRNDMTTVSMDPTPRRLPMHEHTYVQDHPPLPTGRYLTTYEAHNERLPKRPPGSLAVAEERGSCTGCGHRVARTAYFDRDTYRLYRRGE